MLEKILDDDNGPAGVRVDAAKAVLDRAGFAAARAQNPCVDDDRPLHETTTAELDEFIRRGHGRLDVLMAKSQSVIQHDLDRQPDVTALPA